VRLSSVLVGQTRLAAFSSSPRLKVLPMLAVWTDSHTFRMNCGSSLIQSSCLSRTDDLGTSSAVQCRTDADTLPFPAAQRVDSVIQIRNRVAIWLTVSGSSLVHSILHQQGEFSRYHLCPNLYRRQDWLTGSRQQGPRRIPYWLSRLAEGGLQCGNSFQIHDLAQWLAVRRGHARVRQTH